MLRGARPTRLKSQQLEVMKHQKWAMARLVSPFITTLMMSVSNSQRTSKTNFVSGKEKTRRMAATLAVTPKE